MANQYDNLNLTIVILAALHTRLARLLLIEGITEKDEMSMRIREEFLGLRSKLCKAAVWYCPPVVDPWTLYKNNYIS